MLLFIRYKNLFKEKLNNFYYYVASDEQNGEEQGDDWNEGNAVFLILNKQKLIKTTNDDFNKWFALKLISS